MNLLCDVTPQRLNNDLRDSDPLFGALLLDGDPKSFINADVAKWSWHLDGRHFNSPARVTNLGVEINASPISAKVVFLCIGQKVFSRLTDVAVGNIDTFNAYCSSHFHSPLSVEPRFEVVGTDYSPVGTGVNTAPKLTLGVSRERV